MQVKKFEAKTMKEALEMIKRQLGPEAIILSAKDNTQGFGLGGQRSVEVTAAVPEGALRRKAIAEKKIPEFTREKYIAASAKNQREFIEKSNRLPQHPPTPINPIIVKNLRYADILDEEASSVQISGISPVVAKERVRTAAQQAWQAMNELGGPEQKPPPMQTSKPAEIKALHAEIGELKRIIEHFQRVPQTFMAMHPGAEHGLSYELTHSYQKLVNAGISKNLSIEILNRAANDLTKEQLSRPPLIDAWVARYLLETTRVSENRLEAKIHCFVGPSGQGKTASLVKFASDLVITGKKKIAILTTNTLKVGAVEQLKIYAQILNVPFAAVQTPQQLNEALNKLRMVDYVLIDYPGMNLKSVEELDWLKQMLPSIENSKTTHYVFSVMANEESTVETATRYQMIGFSDAIITCLDEAAQHGLIYNFQEKFKIPLHSFGVGRQVPEDLEPATKERVVDLIFKLSKIRKD